MRKSSPRSFCLHNENRQAGFIFFEGQRSFAMDTDNVQETLDRLLEELKSNDPARCLSALRELNGLNFSSRAILLELERLALKGEGEVQAAALAALSSRTSQYIASQRSSHSRLNRNLILKEIDEWQKDGLMEPHQAEVLRRHYDFDIKSAAPSVAVSTKTPEEDRRSTTTKPVEQIEKPPAGPRPSLTQTLLSEASIKVYLYLGAFFVIASALILAALVEAARLPILAVATWLSANASHQATISIRLFNRFLSSCQLTQTSSKKQWALSSLP
jgi:hypothetical protein